MMALPVPLSSAAPSALAGSAGPGALALVNGARSAVRKSECPFNCLSGVFGVCIRHSYFNNLVCNFTCFIMTLDHSLLLYFLFISLMHMCAFACLL